MNFFAKVRKIENISARKTAMFCVIFTVLGLASGGFAKLADVYSEVLGNFTSGMCLWIFLGTLICAFTKHPLRAAAYVFLFCAGMVTAYYLAAEIGDLYYSRQFVSGWSLFTLFTPIFALGAWLARGKGWKAWIVRIGVVIVMICSLFLIPGNLFLDAMAAAAAFAVMMIKEKDSHIQ